MANLTCDECQFWDDGGTHLGRCRKSAPIVVGAIVNVDMNPIYSRGVWPSTAPTDWCGDGMPFDDA